MERTLNWNDFFEAALQDKAAASGLRVQGGQVDTADSSWIDFGSNDYLGLRKHPQVLGTSRLLSPLGSGASPVLSGHTSIHQEVEKLLAALSGSSRSMVFSSGFSCNTGVIAALAQAEDLILSDQLNHASLIDGSRLSKAKVHIYRHLDVESVAMYLRQHRHEFRKCLLVTESVFSMDGDIAPLTELSTVCEKYDCGLVVDEAHATGIYGPKGGGLTEELSLQEKVLCKLGTLSKAIGSVGGFVSGSKSCVHYLINHCRSYIFSTAPSPSVMHGVLAALKLLPGMEQERLKLRSASRQLRAELEQQGWQCSAQDLLATATDPDSPIIPVVVGSAERALHLSRQLLQEKIHVPAIRPPTVPEGSCRLRLSLSVRHTQRDFAKLISVMARITDA